MFRTCTVAARKSALAGTSRSLLARVQSSCFSSQELPLRTQLFINNEWVDAKSKKSFDTINPVDESRIATVQEAGEEDVNLAVAAATKAFESWRLSDGSTRRNLLLKLADLVEQHRDRLAEVESLDNGKPKHVADAADVALTIECFRYYAGWADKVGGKVIQPTQNSSSNFCFTWKQPIGVVGQIIPWNFPLLMQSWKLAPALAMGCTIVMKLSEKTPLSGLLMCDLIKQAGYPAGVVNIVNGHGQSTGEFIARHPDIRKVAFTGSSAVGHKIVEASAQSNMKKVTLELGGKSPMIICKDADLDQAAVACHIGLFLNMGQCCVASSRIFVHEDVHDAFVEKVVALAKRLRTQGDVTSPTDIPLCDLGPQVDKIQFDKILGYIEKGKQEGAKVALGGGRLGSKGYYVQPTVFTEVTDEMTIAKEEIFGPVMQLLKFKTLEEAIKRANSSHYGLAAGICTRDVGTALAAARDLEAGTVWINCYDNFDLAAPFGGVKESGWGREKGELALKNYTESKTVMVPIDPKN
jgi:aldehyde dehydrogenase (NAD+)